MRGNLRICIEEIVYINFAAEEELSAPPAVVTRLFPAFHVSLHELLLWSVWGIFFRNERERREQKTRRAEMMIYCIYEREREVLLLSAVAVWLSYVCVWNEKMKIENMRSKKELHREAGSGRYSSVKTSESKLLVLEV